MMSVVISLISGTFAFSILAFLLYRWIRPKFPVQVNCWFCNTDTKVPYGNKNCWDCPSCEQYNGFDVDGGYNKKIPAQYDDNLNYPINNRSEEFISRDDVLCMRCVQDQRLKIRQLADFVPLDPSRFNEEMEIYERHVEKLYPLCERCQSAVSQILDRQDDLLHDKLQKVYMEKSLSAAESTQNLDLPVQSPLQNSTHQRSLKMCNCLGVVALLSSIIVAIGGLPPMYKHHHDTGLLISLRKIQEVFTNTSSVAGIVGLVFCLLAKLCYGRDRLCRADVLDILTWTVTAVIQNRFLDKILHIYDIISYEVIITLSAYIVNFILSVACLIVNRSSNTESSKKFQRLSLDTSKSSSKLSNMSNGSQFLSASQVGDADQPENLSEEPNNLDDTLSELGSFSLGTAARKSDSSTGVFSTSFQSFNPAPVAGKLSVTQMLKERRPLISPAKLNVNRFQNSTPTKIHHSLSNAGNGPLLSNRQQFSVNRGPSLQPPSENLFRMTSLAAFPNTSSQAVSQPIYTRPTFYEPYNRFKQSSCLGEEMDDAMSQKSQSSLKSSVCPVDSTTRYITTDGKVPFWKSSGFTGFVMGASFVANVFFMYHVLTQKS